MALNVKRSGRLLVSGSALFVCLIAIASRSSYAGDELRNFSLGFGTLSLALVDTKSPDPGLVTARYGFRIAKDFLPYMGTGLAYSYQPEIKPGDSLKFKAGMAGQFGFRYLFGSRTSLNLDYKYLYITPELPRGDTRNPPQSLGIGLDIKF
jgi:opacity protein-like surface antigen